MGYEMNYHSTKFLQTTLVIIFTMVAVANGWIDALAYGTVTLGALANYAYHDVKQKGKDYVS
jgi:hypothetical protein